MSLAFTSEDSFKFNNIIMNPPYNNDMYLDFVTLAHKLATDNVVAITPAKWQAKGGAKNEQFRKDIVPYISEVIMYHDCKELFDIQETSGISAYLVSKEVSGTTVVTNKCSANSTLNDITEVHYEKPVILYPTNYINILNKCRGTKCIKDSLSFKRCVFVGEQERGYSCKKFSTDVDVMQGNKHVGYMPVSELFTTENLEKYKCTSLILISMQVIFNGKPKITGSQSYGILKPNQVPKGSFPCVKYFDTEEQCKSFKSYMESKLISFLFFCGVCGGTLTAEFYRFIPAPKAFDHIFTDQELYKEYDLTDEEIAIIESVIKERK